MNSTIDTSGIHYEYYGKIHECTEYQAPYQLWQKAPEYYGKIHESAQYQAPDLISKSTRAAHCTLGFSLFLTLYEIYFKESQITARSLE